MNPPRLLRPLRPFLQAQLPRATVRSQIPVSRVSTQPRRNGSIASEPSAAATPNAPAAPVASAAPATPKTPQATPAAAVPADPVAPAAPQPLKVTATKPEAVVPEAPQDAAYQTVAPEATEAPEAAAPRPAVPRTSNRSKDPMVQLVEKMEEDIRPAGSLDLSRMPRALEALYLEPLRRVAEYGIPTCDLQLRSYSLPNMEFFCDFALRAAYYLGLPAYGPVPLPKKIERWTVPKGHFVHKKSQENFERITLRRLIQVKDGHPETVQVWLAFLQKYAYYGIGMKANVWEFSKLDVAKEMEKQLPETEKLLESKWQHMGVVRKSPVLGNLEEFMAGERRRISGGR